MLPREERLLFSRGHDKDHYFNPRSHERSDGVCFVLCGLVNISIHAPTRGATRKVYHDQIIYKFQSTLPREERPTRRICWAVYRNISIHAPTRGATNTRVIHSGNTQISIHAPTRGATFCFPFYISEIKFQSTLPREERRGSAPTPADLNISIHAPTRGATYSPLKVLPIKLFQSTLPREERHLSAIARSALSLFQSTLPREERHEDRYEAEESEGFQSTLPREERRSSSLSSTNWFTFQSTLPREERRHQVKL